MRERGLFQCVLDLTLGDSYFRQRAIWRLGFPVGQLRPYAVRPVIPAAPASRNLADSLEQRCRSDGRSEHEKVWQRSCIQASLDQAARQDGLRLAREDKSMFRAGVIQGFDSEPVTREEKRLFGRVPDGDRKHPLQSLENLRSPLGVAVDNDLRIGMVSPEAITLLR